MYRLKVLSGKNAGKSFRLQLGENSIGRQQGNTVVLSSDQVSKRHCVLLISAEEIILRDLKSANGTYVNGSLANEKRVYVGDRIGVGDFVLEVKKAQLARVPQRSLHIEVDRSPLGPRVVGNVVTFPTGNPMAQSPSASGVPAISPELAQVVGNVQVPTDLKGRLLWKFENYVMPFFYNLNLRQDWKSLSVVVFFGFIILNLLMSISPLIQSNEEMVKKESGRRAKFIARQLADLNATAFSERSESKVYIGSADREEGVRIAVITDLDNRIIAPATRLNQYLASGDEAMQAVKAARKFREGAETGVVRDNGANLVIAVEPIKIFDPRFQKNVVVAMATVSIDASLSLPSGGSLGLIFSESFIMTAFLGLITLLILQRLTLKPFEVLNENLDSVLKGESAQITQDFKNEALTPLWDIIRSAVQRLPKGTNSSATDDGGFGQRLTLDEFEPALRVVGQAVTIGMVLCNSDRRVLFLNEHFEEISGIRSTESIGQEFVSQARDQAFGSLIGDLLERSSSGIPAMEEFEFSGVSYRVHCASLGAGVSKGYLFLIHRSDA